MAHNSDITGNGIVKIEVILPERSKTEEMLELPLENCNLLTDT